MGWIVYKTFVEMFTQHYQNVVNVSDTLLLKWFNDDIIYQIFSKQLNISIMLSKYFSTKGLENILEML